MKHSMYAGMTARQLARLTRERGLQKPDVTTLDEWAVWLEQQDALADKSAPEAGMHQARYDTLTVTELRAMLDARGVALTEGSGAGGGVVKADMVAALEAADRNGDDADGG